ncbi:MAG: hypothetical protein QXP39_00495 [Candidatus Aenigmatarchaeota archaeon]
MAAEIAEKAGLKEMAKELYIKVVNDYEKEGKFYDAVRVAKEAGLEEKK